MSDVIRSFVTNSIGCDVCHIENHHHFHHHLFHHHHFHHHHHHFLHYHHLFRWLIYRSYRRGRTAFHFSSSCICPTPERYIATWCKHFNLNSFLRSEYRGFILGMTQPKFFILVLNYYCWNRKKTYVHHVTSIVEDVNLTVVLHLAR